MTKLTTEQVKSIPEMYKNMTNKAIAENLGVSRRTIDYWLHKLRAKGYDIPKKTMGLI